MTQDGRTERSLAVQEHAAVKETMMYSQGLENDYKQRLPKRLTMSHWYLKILTESTHASCNGCQMNKKMFPSTWKLNEELRLYDHVRMNFLGGVRREHDEKILSMHLESHIGLFSAPLYDFNGKALWKHAPQEISKMKCVVIGDEWMFPFSLLAFSLVYFVGLVSQSSDIPLSSKSQILKAFHNLRREDIPILKKKKTKKRKKNIPVGAKCCCGVWLKIWKRNSEMNWKRFTDPWVLFYFFITLSRNELFVLLEFCFLLIYLHHSHR